MSDKYCIPIKYTINANPKHYIDLKETDKYQKEVYVYAKNLMEAKKLRDVTDVGCGSGYKLIHYLGGFNTVGIETEPCISFLRKTYPANVWLDSGESEKSFKSYDIHTDLVICSDVIEHIINPDDLIEFLLSLDTKYYILSTPCRDILVKYANYDPLGPPKNACHVREWTMEEFKQYIAKKFTILESKYATNQKECQFHLLTKKIE
jgi:SAM-dependent methyltransferase